ncbi:MAG: 50S ribosomal protein L17 [Anaerolineae bacterium]|nr:50S ribosomal protein L17 [Anaerolineae bacterium]
MRHRVAGKKLNRSPGHRKALRRNLINQLFTHERITTTRAKAQAVRGEAEKLITMAKRGLDHDDPARAVHARRVVLSRLNNRDSVQKLFDDLAPHYEERPGGYTRVLKLGLRAGDAAEMVILELVDRKKED